MKHVIAALALVLGFQAHAAVTCNINASSKGDDSYDRVLATQEMSQNGIFAIESGTARRIEFSAKENWAALDGRLVISVSSPSEGSYGITVGRVDLKQTENILPLEQMTLGTVTEKQPLNLVLPKKRLSILCFKH